MVVRLLIVLIAAVCFKKYLIIKIKWVKKRRKLGERRRRVFQATQKANKKML